MILPHKYITKLRVIKLTFENMINFLKIKFIKLIANQISILIN